MRKARFSETQIISVIKSVDAGRTIRNACREAAISKATNNNWKAKCGGIDQSDIKRMKAHPELAAGNESFYYRVR